MNPLRLLDIRDYHVRPFRDYRVRPFLDVRPATAVDPNDAAWLPIAALDCFQGRFAQRNPFNLPGPFYGAETDTCGTGPCEAPGNVLLDAQGQEFVCKQPADAEELRAVLNAALVECFEGYGADGDDHWTLSLIRQWSRTRFDLLASLDKLKGHPDGLQCWKHLLMGPAEEYLRVYAFFVEEKRLPTYGDRLPEVG